MADCDILVSQLLAAHGIDGYFTTRRGGVSPPPYDSLNFGADADDAPEHIAINIERLLTRTGLSSPPHQSRQIHQCGHLWCSGNGGMHDTDADTLLSRSTGTAVAVRTADCLPVLLADPISGIIAAVHAGWRGTAAGVVSVAIDQMISNGANIEYIIASLGPCIGPCCFEIGEEAAIALTNSVAGADHHIQAHPLHADLAGINQLQLINRGIAAAHIERHDLCTLCNPERFFSYRRDGRRSGRQLAVVAIPSAT